MLFILCNFLQRTNTKMSSRRMAEALKDMEGGTALHWRITSPATCSAELFTHDLSSDAGYFYKGKGTVRSRAV